MVKGVGENTNTYHVRKDETNNRLKKTCGEFESLFLNYIFKAMRSTIPSGGFFSEDHGGQIIKSMFDENLSKEIASGRGMGVGDMLFEQLKEKAK